MLEVKNLTKVYKTKGGADTHALDGVSVQFPEKGMVFLLGKSGSGKSTLLNVCGGLDAPTSGEIIVKGRSSKDFTQSDFDSYRNTFIGFIFQEYNILNEFSVEDNIALALELQGKSKDKQAIAQLLEEVDLTGYAKRKPNTLSGGQKQRIAIARALVKAPEIIMADEPTGALDSATGKQVFDTLKKLSQDKLVIVVSHDRDFAELYGDRVIELKDGKIISDVSKTQEEQKALSANVTSIGDTLCVKKGAKLSDKDFEEIRAFLKNTDSDIIIATGEKDVKTFKDVSRITDDGGKEVFRDTDESKMEKKSYRPEESKFIRSKLPMRHAMKIGASGLKTKPFRLIFTVLLCTVAFVLFGLLSTMTFYDSSSTLKQTLKDSSTTMLKIGKEYEVQEINYRGTEVEHTWTGTRETRFTDQDLNTYVGSFGNDVFGAVNTSYNNVSFSIQNRSDYYKNSINAFAYLPENNGLRSKIIHGNYPTSNNEICISSYTANAMKECKMLDMNGNALELNSIDQLIGKVVNLNNTKYNIVGIFECGSIDPKFDVFRDDSASEDEKRSLEEKFTAELNDGLHMVAFVSKDKVKDISTQYKNSWYNDDIFSYHNLSVATAYNDETGEYDFDQNSSWSNGAYAALGNYDAEKIVFFDGAKTTLSQHEAVISGNMFLDRIYQPLRKKVDDARYELSKTTSENAIYQQAKNSIINAFHNDTSEEKQNYDIWSALNCWESCEYSNNLYSNPSKNSYIYPFYQDFKTAIQSANLTEDYQSLQKLSRLLQIRERLSSNEYYDYELDAYVELSTTERTAYANEFLANLNIIELSPMTVKARLFNNQDQIAYGEELVYSVVGVFGLNENYYECKFLLNNEVANTLWEDQRQSLEYYSMSTSKYKAPSNAIYDVLYLPYDHTDGSTEVFANLYANKAFAEDGSRVKLTSTLLSGFQMVDNMVENLSKVFLYVGLVMALFSALLLSNFISVSISHKKRDIGILRAVGARSLDVFKIFFSESFVITVICVILAMAGSFAVCNILNAEIASTIGASLFVFGPMSMLILVGVALVTAVVATFLPVYNAAKKKPVDSIRAIV